MFEFAMQADVIRKEQALAEAEQQRLRKLQLNGILPKEKDGAYRKNKVSNTKQENQVVNNLKPYSLHYSGVETLKKTSTDD